MNKQNKVDNIFQSQCGRGYNGHVWSQTFCWILVNRDLFVTNWQKGQGLQIVTFGPKLIWNGIDGWLSIVTTRFSGSESM